MKGCTHRKKECELTFFIASILTHVFFRVLKVLPVVWVILELLEKRCKNKKYESIFLPEVDFVRGNSEQLN